MTRWILDLIPLAGEELSVEGPEAFSEDYFTARRRFRDAAHRLGWTISSYPLDRNGPGGEPLSVDVAISPGSGLDGAIVVSSGLHGVEGFFGSAVQLGWMDRCARDPNSQIRQVLIHALNPYGFAWRRRVNEQNVDPNRNFLPDARDYSGSPAGYAGLNGFLNPERPPSRFDLFTMKALYLLARHGKAKMQQAIAIGQYDFPRGLFYGGDGPSWLRQLLDQHFTEWIGDCRDVAHLDLHTGLGKSADCQVLVDYPLKLRLRDRLEEWFGHRVFTAYETNAVAYKAPGGLGHWLVNRHLERDYSFAVVELGTYPSTLVLKGLRAENQAHHWGQTEDAVTRKVKARLVELFCPLSPKWRGQVFDKTLNLLEQAQRGLETTRAQNPS